MSVFIGPLHRHYKACNTAATHFFAVRGHYPDIFKYFAAQYQRTPLYGPLVPPPLCERMDARSQSSVAQGGHGKPKNNKFKQKV